MSSHVESFGVEDKVCVWIIPFNLLLDVKCWNVILLVQNGLYTKPLLSEENSSLINIHLLTDLCVWSCAWYTRVHVYVTFSCTCVTHWTLLFFLCNFLDSTPMLMLP